MEKPATTKKRGRPKKKPDETIDVKPVLNVTKRGRGRPKKTVILKIKESVSDLLAFHPVTGVSKDNELLKAILKSRQSSSQSEPVLKERYLEQLEPEQEIKLVEPLEKEVENEQEQEKEHEKEQEKEEEQLETEPVLIKKTKLVLNKDNTEQYITEILKSSACNKNYQHTPEQQERYDELIKLPASTDKPDKNSLKKIFSELIGVSMDYVKNTKKFGLTLKTDFVPMILCLEKYYQQNKEAPVQVEEKEAAVEQAIVEEEEEIYNEPEPILLDKESEEAIRESSLEGEEVRKVFEEENVEEPKKVSLFSFLSSNPVEKKVEKSQEPMPDIDSIEKNEFETGQEEQTVPLDIESTEYNKFLNNKEIREHKNLKDNKEYEFLYPEINDPNFNIKIASHKEFNDTKYDGTIYDIEEHAKKLCNTDFELTPHQLFVKNFLSLQTPYNALLLYHGLGTGKTCSSIGIAEEMRSYMKQVGITQPILIIASPNVQENYRLQLFDERKLKLISGQWNLNTCIGEALLQEVNPTNLSGVPKDRIISEINQIINKNYRFMGYIELANYIKRVINIPTDSRFTAKQLKELKIKKVKKYFDNRLIIIDEVHNIHISEQNKEESKTASLLMDIARYTTSMRMLLLSATPMYNSHKEIIWLTNLLNIVNKQSTIKESDVFDKDGNFKKESEKNLETGLELLTRKLTGYVSYVRGENPYTFPYRIYPDVFSPENSLDHFVDVEKNYPTTQMNGREIEGRLENIPVFLTEIGEYQAKGYDFIIKHMRNKSNNLITKFGEERDMPSFENMESFGYTFLLKPLEALDIVFPNKDLDNKVTESISPSSDKSSEDINEFDDERNEEMISKFIGKKGLSNTMKYTVQRSPYPNVYDYEYRPEILNDLNHGRIFHPDKIGKYSNKIAKICESIKNSKGIVLIYSQYIEGSIIPIALALEEMGITRFSSANYVKPLFKTPPTEPLDSRTMKPRSQFLRENDNDTSTFMPAKYVMITGNKAYSPNNLEDIKFVTNPNNLNGEKVKVVIISKAGSEGLDFKCIRQIHILDPWYNMSRIEQIIGRGVRNFSHCMLQDFKDRNVEIYLHATIPRNDEEPADLYVYRYSEKKAKLIGKVTRILKEISIDCLLNIGQHNFTVQQLSKLANNKNMQIRVSSKPELIDYQIGDRDYSEICDYEVCETEFKCSPNVEISKIIKDTYNEDYAKMNYLSIVKRIRQLYKKKLVYDRQQIFDEITILKSYPEDQIDFALSRFVDNKNEYIYDELGRTGYLINRDNYYVFQPLEITQENSTMFDRSVPVDFKQSVLELEIEQKEKGKGNVASVVPGNEDKMVEESYKNLYSALETIFDIIEEANDNKETKKLTKEVDWYINFGYVYELLIEKHGIEFDILAKYVTYHYLDTLSLADKLTIVKYYYSGVKDSYESYEKIIQQYFSDKVVKVRGFNTIFFASDVENVEEEKMIFIQDNENKYIWSNALPTDRMEALKQSMQFLLVPLVKLNRLFGFIQLQNENFVFKTFDKMNKLKKGVVCNVEGKRDVIKRINFVSGFTYSDKLIDVENFIPSKDIVKPGLCVILEVLLRYYDDQRKNDMRWFLNTEQILLSKITA